MTSRYRVDYSPKAFSELAEIYAYTAQDSQQAAISMVERIMAGIDGLELVPYRNVVPGQPENRRHLIRSLPVPPYMVFFRIIKRDFVVEIVRIRHGAQRRLKRY